MSLLRLDVDALYAVLGMCDTRDICALGAVSTHTALYVLECLTYYNVRRWSIMYPVYLRARYAVHASTHQTLGGVWFLRHLSRACRACGTRTQRRVHDCLLCASCTRNPYARCWMIPETVAMNHYHVHVPVHRGPRCDLVFAEHVQTAASWRTGWREVTREMLVYFMGSRRPSRR
jgi:hypothetical protein